MRTLRRSMKFRRAKFSLRPTVVPAKFSLSNGMATASRSYSVPVQLNELVKEGNFAYDQPFDLNNAIAIVAPDYPGALGSKALQQEIQKPSTTSRNGTRHSYQRSVSYYVVSNDGKWTPMRTVTAGNPGLRNAVYHPGLHSLNPAPYTRLP